jgi:uncharacterized membrane protein HdeD (DUF308 family)
MSNTQFDPGLGFLTPQERAAGEVARRWWVLALRGVLAIVFGCIFLLVPGLSLLVLALWFGAYMAVDGIFGLVTGIGAVAHHRQGGGALILEGILGLVVGAMALWIPWAAVAAFVYLAAAWAIVSGAALLWGAFVLEGLPGRVLMGLAGVLSVIWGALIAAVPVAGAVVLAWWLGAYGIFTGVLLLSLAFSLRRSAGGGAPGSGAGGTLGNGV